MTAIGALLTCICCLTTFFAPRRWAAWATIASVCYLTQGQQIYVLGSHFTAVRLVLIAGILRLWLKGELNGIRLNGIDQAVLFYAFTSLFAYTLREKSTDGFVYILGCSYDILFSYFLIRRFINNLEEAEEFFRGLSILIIPLALFMLLHAATGNNIFRAMGGQGWVEEEYRSGRIRAVGSFQGPHTAGIFGATLVIIFFGSWFVPALRLISFVGIVAAGLICFSSNSSGPLLALFSGILGWLSWPFRQSMKSVRWGIVAALLALQLVMQAPLWFLFMKIGNLTGGDGWTRSFIIDSAINHISEWWLIGSHKTGHWMGNDMGETTDVTNGFVVSGLKGGALGLFFYILIIVRCFRNLGFARSLAKDRSLEAEKFLWGLGCALLAHVMAQFTISYFDQIHVVWWGLLAIISSTTSDVANTTSMDKIVVDSAEPSPHGA